MPSYTLLLSYDGTAYSGWQQQQNHASVLGTLEAVFRHVCKQNASFLGTSRTDAGVHALGQIVRCVTPLVIEPHRLTWILNNSLPADIHIRKTWLASDTWHPHHNIAYKTYYYHFCITRPLPFITRYCWHWRKSIDIEKLNSALQLFMGTHDFRAFCCVEDAQRSTIRTIDHLSLHYITRYASYRIVVQGETFLRHMIRRIVGVSIQFASNPLLNIDSIKRALDHKNPQQTFLNAPAQGLLLYSIRYKNDNRTGNTI